MIATCNIKVNGRWYRAGEEYEAEEQKTPKKVSKQDIPEAETPADVTEEVKSEPKAESKPRSTTRRKRISE